MAASKLVVLTIFIALAFTQSWAESPVGDEEIEVTRSDGSDSSSSYLKVELEQLKSKTHVLETQVDERTQELKQKDEVIAQKEKIIQEKSNSIASLEREIDSLQRKGTLDAQEQVGKAHARAGELANQVDKLKKEIERQHAEKVALESRVSGAEEKIHQLNLKLGDLQKINDKQKSQIRKTERALQVAEEEMMKAKFEATSKMKELMEVHSAWFPPWLAVHFFRLQSFVETHWSGHGKPAVDIILQKAVEKKAQAEKWAEPHVETFKTKWIPAIKEQWLLTTTKLEPHVQLLSVKTVEFYEASKSTITPHVIKAHEFADPYFQEAKKFSKPYIDQVATVAKPHVDKARTALKPYTKRAVRVYGQFLKSATMYHNKVQESFQDTLKKHELTKPLATKELVWFAASAFLALPIIILFRVFSVIFCKKTRKPVRNAPTNHARRKAKRSHTDK